MRTLKTVLLSFIFYSNFARGADVPLSEENNTPINFKGHILVEVKPKTAEDVTFLQELDDSVPDDVLDFWASPTKPEEPVPILIHPELLEPVKETFENKSIAYSIRIQDFQEVIEDEMKQIETEGTSGLDFRNPSNRAHYDLFNYHKLEEINQYLSAIENSKSDLGVDFSTKQVATTYEGRPISYVSITSMDKSKKRAAIWIDCGIHAREWISVAFCPYVIDRLLDNSELGMTDNFDFYIMPVTNPDGYVYTWGSNRMWRKNRRPSSAFLKLKRRRQSWNPYPTGFPALGGAQYPVTSGSQSKCVGTDPNRNFDILHARVGSSPDPCQDTFHGETAFSEQESKAVRDSLNELISKYGSERVAAYVSVHAFSQYWMTPSGHTKERPKDYKDHQRVAALSVSALSKLFQTPYQYGPINEIIYEASGSSVDYAYSKLGIKYSYGLELRDQGQTGFMLPVNQIKPTVQETWEGIKAMASALAKEFPPE